MLLKEEGNAAFKNKLYMLAKKKWREALYCFPLLPIILGNIAVVKIFLQQPMNALLSGIACIALKPQFARFYARTALAAMHCQLYPFGLECAEVGLKFDPTNADLQLVRKDCKVEVARLKASASLSGEALGDYTGMLKPTAESESDLDEITRRGHAGMLHTRLLKVLYLIA